jgi:hypothetical protein
MLPAVTDMVDDNITSPMTLLLPRLESDPEKPVKSQDGGALLNAITSVPDGNFNTTFWYDSGLRIPLGDVNESVLVPTPPAYVQLIVALSL